MFVPLNRHGFGWIQTGYAGPSQGLLTWAGHMILPWITLAAVQAAVYTRLTRGPLLDTLGEDYIRTARAKGLTERRVTYQHAVRAALTRSCPSWAWTWASCSAASSWSRRCSARRPRPGGRAAIATDDLPVIIGFVIVAAVFVVVANIIVDLVYALLDPRVRIA